MARHNWSLWDGPRCLEVGTVEAADDKAAFKAVKLGSKLKDGRNYKLKVGAVVGSFEASELQRVQENSASHELDKNRNGGYVFAPPINLQDVPRGTLLDEMLREMGLMRDDAWWTEQLGRRGLPCDQAALQQIAIAKSIHRFTAEDVVSIAKCGIDMANIEFVSNGAHRSCTVDLSDGYVRTSPPLSRSSGDLSRVTGPNLQEVMGPNRINVRAAGRLAIELLSHAHRVGMDPYAVRLVGYHYGSAHASHTFTVQQGSRSMQLEVADHHIHSLERP